MMAAEREHPTQLTLMELSGDAPGASDTSQYETSAESSAIPDFQLPILAERFLEHLQRVRRCSSRTVEAYASDYNKLIDCLGAAGHSLDVREIAPDHIERCIAELSHLSAASVRRFVYAVRSFFGYLFRLEIIRRNPAEDVPLPQKEQTVPKFFSAEQVEALSEACRDDREAVIIGLLRYCGLRRAELLDLNVGDISADLNSITVSGKGRKERCIPVHSELKDVIRRYINDLPDDDEEALIRNTVGTRMSETSFYRLFHRLMERASLGDTDLTPHSLRHHFGSALAQAGVDVATIAELMGHSNIQTTSIYLHSNAPSKRRAIERLGAASDGTSGDDTAPLCPTNCTGGDHGE
jgi:site-specific recombinase XerD